MLESQTEVMKKMLYLLEMPISNHFEERTFLKQPCLGLGLWGSGMEVLGFWFGFSFGLGFFFQEDIGLGPVG